MASANPVGPSNQRNQQITDPTSSFSSRELANEKRTKALRIATTTILGTIAAGVGAAGIALALTLGSPVFFGLLVVSVLLAGIALLAYKSLSQKENGNWQEALEQNFRQLPPQTVNANFVITPGTNVAFYQNKKNPGVKLGIQGDKTTTFALKLNALPKSNTPRAVTSESGMIFHAVSSNSMGMFTLNTNQAKAFFQELTKNKKFTEWSKCQYKDLPSVPQIFTPTETRSNKLTLKADSKASILEKERIPEFLGFVKGPKISDFSGDDQEVVNRYYQRALLSYENCFAEALEKNCSIVAVPLFSSVYETGEKDATPKADREYQWVLNCRDLCKKALIDAVNNLALGNPNSLKLLILLQDPFAAE
ncbi:hypothetical protein [Chlamydia vaughanii]|uniref:hypothetical protein n=1 Tax=Chlamydia vaughanii TaxID=3112552 RepID=UPI0032B13588